MLPRIDHVVINVRDGLDAAAAQYRRLGFALTPRGHHSLGSSNHLAIFGDDYLELLGQEPDRTPRRTELWQAPAGLNGLVFKPPAGGDLAAVLAERGVPADPPRSFVRPVALAEGTREARFRTTTLPGAVATGRVFFCEHFTPELVWREEWRGHPNGVTGLAAFVIATDLPARDAAPFAQLFGADALAPVAGGLALAAGNAALLLLTPAEIARRYGDAVPSLPTGETRMVALELRVGSLAVARAALAEGGIADVREQPDRVVVPAAVAAGVTLAFIG
ncbi:VOC family protein [Rhodovastum atsumiense]|uniref:VOC family protein n=1 Tax=Rhodovastum atsumiense TaxID=504468 RepID=A0A5M6ILF8_9PROT|nr:VOC family protein [Rhodovastum atsumiense]